MRKLDGIIHHGGMTLVTLETELLEDEDYDTVVTKPPAKYMLILINRYAGTVINVAYTNNNNFDDDDHYDNIIDEMCNDECKKVID